MSRRKKTAQQLRAEILQLCGEIHDDDGIDPREWFKTQTFSNKQNRKIWQLCRQVAKVLEYVLSDCDDPLVQNMDVVTVMPHPDSSCLRVEVVCHERSTPAQAQQAIQQQSIRLQYEIARSIHRKRVPNLTFSVSFPEGGIIDKRS